MPKKDQRYAAFLRAINVGGHNTVKMEDLRALFTGLGLTGVETFIASGNVLFQSSRPPAALEKDIEACLEKALGYTVAAFVRTADQLREIAAYEPFASQGQALNIGFLKRPLDPAATAAVMALQNDIDEFHTRGTEFYWLCQKKQSASKFSNAVFERLIKAPATFRSATTVVKIAARFQV